MFREENGKVSFTRVSSFLLVIAYLVWASYIVFVKNEIPPMPMELVYLIGIAYGINKVAPNIRLKFGGGK